MTTSPQPWSLDPHDANVVLDRTGAVVLRALDWRDAERVVELCRGPSEDDLDDLRSQLKEAEEELKSAKEECTQLEEATARRESPVPFHTPLPWFADWSLLELHTQFKGLPVAEFHDAGDLDLVVRALEGVK